MSCHTHRSPLWPDRPPLLPRAAAAVGWTWLSFMDRLGRASWEGRWWARAVTCLTLQHGACALGTPAGAAAAALLCLHALPRMPCHLLPPAGRYPPGPTPTRQRLPALTMPDVGRPTPTPTRRDRGRRVGWWWWVVPGGQGSEASPHAPPPTPTAPPALPLHTRQHTSGVRWRRLSRACSTVDLARAWWAGVDGRGQRCQPPAHGERDGICNEIRYLLHDDQPSA